MTRLLVRCLPAVAAAAAVAAGCGGSNASPEPASFAQPGTRVFLAGTIRPEGELKTNVDRAAQKIAGIENLGEFIVEQIEQKASAEREPVDFAKEVEPWLGEEAGIAFEKVDTNGDLSEPLIAVEATDPEAAKEFVEKQTKEGKAPYRESSYGGVDYKVGGPEDTAIGVIDEFLVFTEGEKAFKAAIDASSGESLADDSRFQDAMSGATEGSLADVYVDVGGLIGESGGQIDPQVRQLLKNAGIDPSESTLVASLVPHRENLEIDLSSELGGEEPPSGDSSALLGSLPAGSFAAFAVSGFGEQLREAIDSLDRSGIPGQVPPGQLKSGLKEAGIDLDKLAGSLKDAGVFAEGNSKSSLGGALVLTSTESKEAAETVASIGTILRSTRTPGVTAISGRATGFSVRSKELGSKPLVVVTEGDRIAIGYGVAPTLRGVATPSGATLAGKPAYKEAVAALGETPIAAFVDGPAALELAEALVPKSDIGFKEAKRYLRSVSSLALGSAPEGDLAKAKLIVGLGG